jgi:hypothetical protein
MSPRERIENRLRMLRMIERDIVVEKQVRQQIADRRESTTDVDQRIDSLKITASALRESLEKCR